MPTRQTRWRVRPAASALSRIITENAASGLSQNGQNSQNLTGACPARPTGPSGNLNGAAARSCTGLGSCHVRGMSAHVVLVSPQGPVIPSYLSSSARCVVSCQRCVRQRTYRKLPIPDTGTGDLPKESAAGRHFRLRGDSVHNALVLFFVEGKPERLRFCLCDSSSQCVCACVCVRVCDRQ